MTAAGVKETLLENQQSFIVGKMDMKGKQKGDVTKFIPTKRALPRIIWSGAEPFVL